MGAFERERTGCYPSLKKTRGSEEEGQDEEDEDENGDGGGGAHNDDVDHDHHDDHRSCVRARVS